MTQIPRPQWKKREKPRSVWKGVFFALLQFFAVFLGGGRGTDAGAKRLPQFIKPFYYRIRVQEAQAEVDMETPSASTPMASETPSAAEVTQVLPSVRLLNPSAVSQSNPPAITRTPPPPSSGESATSSREIAVGVAPLTGVVTTDAPTATSAPVTEPPQSQSNAAEVVGQQSSPQVLNEAPILPAGDETASSTTVVAATEVPAASQVPAPAPEETPAASIAAGLPILTAPGAIRTYTRASAALNTLRISVDDFRRMYDVPDVPELLATSTQRTALAIEPIRSAREKITAASAELDQARTATISQDLVTMSGNAERIARRAITDLQNVIPRIRSTLQGIGTASRNIDGFAETVTAFRSTVAIRNNVPQATAALTTAENEIALARTALVEAQSATDPRIATDAATRANQISSRASTSLRRANPESQFTVIMLRASAKISDLSRSIEEKRGLPAASGDYSRYARHSVEVASGALLSAESDLEQARNAATEVEGIALARSALTKADRATQKLNADFSSTNQGPILAIRLASNAIKGLEGSVESFAESSMFLAGNPEAQVANEAATRSLHDAQSALLQADNPQEENGLRTARTANRLRNQVIVPALSKLLTDVAPIIEAQEKVTLASRSMDILSRHIDVLQSKTPDANAEAMNILAATRTQATAASSTLEPLRVANVRTARTAAERAQRAGETLFTSIKRRIDPFVTILDASAVAVQTFSDAVAGWSSSPAIGENNSRAITALRQAERDLAAARVSLEQARAVTTMRAATTAANQAKMTAERALMTGKNILDAVPVNAIANAAREIEILRVDIANFRGSEIMTQGGIMSEQVARSAELAVTTANQNLERARASQRDNEKLSKARQAITAVGAARKNIESAREGIAAANRSMRALDRGIAFSRDVIMRARQIPASRMSEELWSSLSDAESVLNYSVRELGRARATPDYKEAEKISQRQTGVLARSTVSLYSGTAVDTAAQARLINGGLAVPVIQPSSSSSGNVFGNQALPAVALSHSDPLTALAVLNILSVLGHALPFGGTLISLAARAEAENLAAQIVFTGRIAMAEAIGISAPGPTSFTEGTAPQVITVTIDNFATAISNGTISANAASGLAADLNAAVIFGSENAGAASHAGTAAFSSGLTAAAAGAIAAAVNSGSMSVAAASAAANLGAAAMYGGTVASVMGLGFSSEVAVAQGFTNFGEQPDSSSAPASTDSPDPSAGPTGVVGESPDY